MDTPVKHIEMRAVLAGFHPISGEAYWPHGSLVEQCIDSCVPHQPSGNTLLIPACCGTGDNSWQITCLYVSLPKTTYTVLSCDKDLVVTE